MKELNKIWIQALLFLAATVSLFFFLGFDDLISSGPHGLHLWRQTDSLSFATQYFNHQNSFFKPELYNLKNIDGKAACEFPITYYLTSLLYFVFGKNTLILKLLHLIIVGTGLFFVFRLSFHLLQDYFYASAITLFLFTSTVFNDYSFNYLPDAPALGFTFLGWYFCFRYLNNPHNNTLVTSLIFFVLAGLIKVTYLINPLSIFSLALLAILFPKKELLEQTQARKIVIGGVICLILVLIWNLYILYYNYLSNSTSFNTKPLPIWNLSRHQIAEVWDYISNYWHSTYFAHSSFHLLYVILLFQIIFIRKADRGLSMLISILALGSISYFILFYSQFKDHDYYFLAFIPLVVLLLINGLKTFQNFTSNRYFHFVIKLIFSVIIIAGINYSRIKLYDRHHRAEDNFSKISALIYHNKANIESLKIPKNSKFIVAPDLCPNGGLLFLDRMGWNIEKKAQITVDTINALRSLGADYLLLMSDDSISLPIDEISGKLIFNSNGIEIYELKKAAIKLQ